MHAAQAPNPLSKSNPSLSTHLQVLLKRLTVLSQEPDKVVKSILTCIVLEQEDLEESSA